ncbi:DNA-directed RNA polymerase subunit L [Candidatus Woesearchaeota archaeon]|nr:DNA-directed RNA polymerase subunit L [Candidatus Woesearchaeota archaeon]
MEINILEDKAQKLVFELVGADHSMCNVLRKVMQENPKIKVATYSIAHPLIGIPKFIVETESGTKPRDALKSAIIALEKMNKDFTAKVNAA